MAVKPQCKDEKAALVERISDSQSFLRAPKLRDLFLHICKTSLAGKDHLLVEQQIGQQVFGREPGYNPGDDSIVRAQVRLLRRKLDSWYADEGREETLRISIPRGGYVPVWTEIVPESVISADPAPPAAPSVAESTPVATSDARRLRVSVVVLGLAAAFVGGWFLSRWFASPPAAVHPFRSHPVLAKFLDNKEPVLVVVQDASLILLNNTFRTATSLADYRSGQYKERLSSPAFDADFRRLLQMIDSRQYTSLGDAGIVRSLVAAMPDAHERVQVVSARHLHPRQLKTSNAILIGGYAANPWTELFEPSLSFRLVTSSPSGGLVVRNFDPRPGEEEYYRPDKGVGYGVLAAIPNSEGNGTVFLMQGDRLESTEASAEFALSTQKAQAFSNMLQKAASGSEVRRFQAVIRTRLVQGTSTASEVVALRVN